MKKRRSLPRFPHQVSYHTGLLIRRLLCKITSRMVIPQMAVYEKAQGFWVSRAIVVACELDIADHLSDGPKGIAELSIITGTDESNLYRLMRMLAGEGIFRESKGRIFENTRLSEPLKEGEGSMKHMILHQFCEGNQRLFSVFLEIIRTGESYSRKMMGKSIFQFLEENPERNSLYNKAMDDSSGIISLALISSYDFSEINTIVDIGGGHGIILARILDRYPKMHGILFDQPHVVAPVDSILADFRLNGRLKVVPGNFFEDVPVGADAYFMKNILHAFSDEDCEGLLRKVFSAMGSGGKLIIVETVITPDNRPSMGKRLDLLMMIGTEGGKERTKDEFVKLLSGSGFKGIRFVRTVAPFSVIEGTKI
jgi:hypothetical protein